MMLEPASASHLRVPGKIITIVNKMVHRGEDALHMHANLRLYLLMRDTCRLQMAVSPYSITANAGTPTPRIAKPKNAVASHLNVRMSMYLKVTCVTLALHWAAASIMAPAQRTKMLVNGYVFGSCRYHTCNNTHTLSVNRRNLVMQRLTAMFQNRTWTIRRVCW